MAIIIRMKNGKWEVHVDEEVWLIEDIKKFHEILDKIIEYKDKYGRVPNNLKMID